MITLVALALALLFLPAPWNWLLVIGAAVIDVIETGVFLWWSRRRRAAVGVETLPGRNATTVGPLLPTGQVRIDGELWEARSATNVEPGEEVVIRAVDGLVLDVEPTGSDHVVHNRDQDSTEQPRTEQRPSSENPSAENPSAEKH